MPETFDFQPGTLFADTAGRTISGIAIPANATATKGGKTWRFGQGSVHFGQRTPLLRFHDITKPVGRLTSYAWTAEGLRVTFSVSRTVAGDEALQLAHDQVLGLSVGIDVPEGGARLVGDELHVSMANAAEVSLTPIPAFAGATIDHVSLSNEGASAVPDAPITEPVAVPPVAPTVTFDAEALGRAIAAGLTPQPPATPEGPTTVPIPVAQTTVTREEPLYNFTGTAGRFGFIRDARDASQGSGEAAQRISEHLHETFVVQANVTALNPPIIRADLWQGPLRYNRPLSGLISTGTITDNTPFVLPKFGSAGGMEADHVEGVEPALGTFTATNQTVVPKAMSGKVSISRETWDAGGSPQVDQLIWNEMQAAHVEAAEVRIAALLDGLTLTPVAVNGSDVAVVDAMTNELVGLQFLRGGNRFSALALSASLYGSLISAKDLDGRKLLPILNPQNADGSVSNDFGKVQIGNAAGTPAWALSTNSYLLVPTSVYQWTSVPTKLTMDYLVAQVFLGMFSYSAEAVIRSTDVIRITHS